MGSAGRAPTAGLIVAVAVAILGFAGCGDAAEVSRDALPELVLQEEDLPGFALFDEGRQTRTDLPQGERSDAERFGREGGWKARFRRPGGSPETEGPLVVESRADVFADADGAEKDLAAARTEIESAWDALRAPDLGDEAWAATSVQQAVGGDVRYFTVAWRDGNVVASVLVQGFDRGLELDDVLALAQKQQERIGASRAS